MKTQQKLLNTDTTTPEGKAELSLLLGEVFRVKHNTANRRQVFRGGGKYCDVCRMFVHEGNGCKVPLDDWNEAMKWRDWAVEKYGEWQFLCALKKVFGVLILDSCDFKVIITKAQPEDYLKATAICALGDK